MDNKEKQGPTEINTKSWWEISSVVKEESISTLGNPVEWAYVIDRFTGEVKKVRVYPQ